MNHVQLISTVRHQFKSASVSLLGLPGDCPLFPSSWSPVALWLRVSRAALPRIERCAHGRPCSLRLCWITPHVFVHLYFYDFFFSLCFWLWRNCVFYYHAWTQLTVCSQASVSTDPPPLEAYKPPYLTVPQTGIVRSREPERPSGGFAPSTRTTSSHPGPHPIVFSDCHRIMFTCFPSEWK